MTTHITRSFARKRLKRPFNHISAAYLARPFSKSSRPRVQFYFAPNDISYTQIYPFLTTKLPAQIRLRNIQSFLDLRVDDADVYVLQPWFTVDEEILDRALKTLRQHAPDALVIFMDSYAHNDMRLARTLEPYIDLYLKKSVFKDLNEFLRPYKGDTNLTEFYSSLYGIKASPVDFNVPRSILPKVGLSPGFLTSPNLFHEFLNNDRPSIKNRNIDIHSRLAHQGSPWYSSMRQHATQVVRDLPRVRRSSEDRVPKSKFLEEMQHSKTCWSPFGYGELCWRDIEAFLTGAALIKPDMSHLETAPELFIPGETYAPVRWDFSDFQEVVGEILADEDYREHLSKNAFDKCRNYLSGPDFKNWAVDTLKLHN